MLEGALWRELVLRMTRRACPALTLLASALALAPKVWPAKLVEAHAVTAAMAETRTMRAAEGLC